MLLWKKDNQTPSALADATIRDATTMTRLLDSMVKKDLVNRIADTNDRRRVIIHLSKKGKSLQKVLVPIAKQFIKETLEDIPNSEVEAAMRTLQKITNKLINYDTKK